MTASLYGITHSNRNFSDPYYWGKNQFNSSFPIALACYMREQQIPLVYLVDTGRDGVTVADISVDDVFATKIANDGIFFSFESRFQPYERFVHDTLKPIDLVTMIAANGQSLRPVEIKLTTLPDSTTCNRDDADYGCELVIRNPTTRYMALSMVESCEDRLADVRQIFETDCHRIRSWDNAAEVQSHLPGLLGSLQQFLEAFNANQRPLLMQPVWKTVGMSAELAENCLDIFAWSDFALARLIVDLAIASNPRITRPQRSAIRLIRFLYEATRGRVYQGPIYDGMTYDTLNDKEFAVSGARTNSYMRCPRLARPIVSKSEIKRIIRGGGQKFLSPERRFDAIIFYSSELFDDDNG